MKSNLVESAHEAITQINKAVDERFFRNTKIISESLETDYLPLRYAAIKYHISESYLYKLKHQQRLKFYKLGSISYIRCSELENLFEEVTA